MLPFGMHNIHWGFGTSGRCCEKYLTQHTAAAQDERTISRKSETPTKSSVLCTSALIFAGTEGKKDGWIYTGLLNSMISCTRGTEPYLFRNTTLADSRVVGSLTHTEQGHALQSTAIVSACSVTLECFIHKIPCTKCFHICAQKAMGAIWLPGLSALYSEYFLL